MNIVIYAFGTRGDVQPCIAFAQGLQRAGHRVTLAAGDNFAEWIERHGLPFAPIGVDIQAMMQSPEGIAWVEAPMQDQPKHMRRLFAPASVGLSKAIWRLSEGADLLISSFTCDGLALTAARLRKCKWASLSLQPMRPTRSGSATVFAPRPRANSLLNKFSGEFSARMLWPVFGEFHNAFRAKMGMAKQDRAAYYDEVGAGLTLHAFSRHVVPQPVDWRPNWPITGYWFLDEPGWAPPPPLEAFVARGPKPIYIGFGSATDSDAEATTRLIVEAVDQARCRVVLSGGWAGLKLEESRDDIFVLRGGVSHDWLFPRTAGVVHHGGAGTTAAAFRAGVPQLVVPHFAEQPYWGRRTHELGVAPKPIDKRKISSRALTAALKQMGADASLQQQATQLGAKIRAEDGVAAAVNLIETTFNRS